MKDADLYICPRCGDLAELDDSYGWCLACIADSTGRKVCSVCNARIIHQSDTTCHYCKDDKAVRNGQELPKDAIKRIVKEQNVTFKIARQLYYENIRPTCQCCGNSIARGRKVAKFCASTPECVKAQGRYKSYHRRWRNGYRRSEEEAVRLAINGIKIATAIVPFGTTEER